LTKVGKDNKMSKLDELLKEAMEEAKKYKDWRITEPLAAAIRVSKKLPPLDEEEVGPDRNSKIVPPLHGPMGDD
jgi:hypothetical protein